MTTTIKQNYNYGGTGLGNAKDAASPTLNSVLKAIASDLVAVGGPEITSPDAAVAAGAAPDKAEFDVVVALVNELKAAANRNSGTLAAPVLVAGAAETYDLSGPGELVLTVKVDGVDKVFTFKTTDFVDVSAATAAELAGALNQRGDLRAAGVVARDNAGTLELLGLTGGSHSLQGVAGGANAVLLFPTAAVYGTGFVPSFQVK